MRLTIALFLTSFLFVAACVHWGAPYDGPADGHGTHAMHSPPSPSR